MMNEPTVFLVDADKSTRKAVCDLASTMNLRCEAFALGQEFLDSYTPSQSGCLVLEVRIPDVNGLDIQDHLRAQGAVIPVVFLTGRATVSIAVRAMRTGAMHFLEKPFRDHELWDAIHEAIVLDEKRRRALKERQERERELAAITLKERHVLKMIAEGKSKAAMASEAGDEEAWVDFRGRTGAFRPDYVQRILPLASHRDPGQLRRFCGSCVL
jgi:two-component system response regulator FixJ